MSLKPSEVLQLAFPAEHCNELWLQVVDRSIRPGCSDVAREAQARRDEIERATLVDISATTGNPLLGSNREPLGRVATAAMTTTLGVAVLTGYFGRS
jgi:hypothetical protein